MTVAAIIAAILLQPAAAPALDERRYEITRFDAAAEDPHLIAVDAHSVSRDGDIVTFSYVTIPLEFPHVQYVVITQRVNCAENATTMVSFVEILTNGRTNTGGPYPESWRPLVWNEDDPGMRKLCLGKWSPEERRTIRELEVLVRTHKPRER